MAWIEIRRLRSGVMTYWIRDKRDGKQIVILAGHTKEEADKEFAKYKIRHSLEKKGYDDRYTPSEHAMLDRLYGAKSRADQN